MFDQRRRRWNNIKQTSGQRLVFVVYSEGRIIRVKLENNRFIQVQVQVFYSLSLTWRNTRK